MSPFDGTSRNKAWETPRGLKAFGGVGASGTRRTSPSLLPRFPHSYSLPIHPHPHSNLHPPISILNPPPPPTVADNRRHVIRSYEAGPANDPLMKAWYRNRLIAYNTELIDLCGSDMTCIYSSSADRTEQAIRREMEELGYTQQIMKLWGMIDGEEEEDLIDDFEPHFY